MTASAGRVLTFGEPDYRYGVGPLTLRVERIDRHNPASLDGELWYPVVGVQIGRGDAELGRREVLVRAKRLPS
jgi:hypothetical protein